MTKAAVQASKARLDKLIAAASVLVKKGTPKKELMARLRAETPEWRLERPEWSREAVIDRFYDEIKATLR